jgi:hypothetical protein
MDYRDFAGHHVRITTKEGEVVETFVFGFRFDDETEEKTLEIWTEGYTVDVDDIASIVKIEE